MKRSIAVMLAVLLILQLTACGAGKNTEAETTEEPVTSTEAETTTEEETTSEEETTTEEETTEPEPDPLDAYKENEFFRMILNSYTYGRDYTSLYAKYGSSVTIADVIEDAETGFAYIEADGERHLLGLDFLSMAMICNTRPAGKYATEDDVYAAWWRLYVQRWNYLMPEIPLYANDYYCVYNVKLGGVKEHPVTAVWSVLDALVEWTSSDGSITIGSTTKATGQFRYPFFGNTATNAADKDISQLVNGLETVSRTKNAGYVWNNTVVREHSETENEDGTVTCTIKLWDDLKFSDGSRITAKDYLAFPMVFYSPLGEAASGRQDSGAIYAGWDEYLAYTGPADGKGSKVFSGIRMIDDLTFSLTVSKEYVPSFYDMAMISLQPYYAAMWLGGAEIRDDGEGCYLTDDFYAKNADGTYVTAEHIKHAATDTSGKAYAEYPYSGPYFIMSFNESDGTVKLTKNVYFKGNYQGTKPSIGSVTYRLLTAKREMIELGNGSLDFAGGISGAAAIADAVNTANKDKNLDTIKYRRAGYGKLGFRCDFGPTQFTEVRQAIAYLLDRQTIAAKYTGGYGGLVDGPYYEGSWMYSLAKAQGLSLNAYTASEEKARKLLEEGGWVYDKDGNDYVSGLRYKRIPAEIMDEFGEDFSSIDGEYKITRVGDYFYMPLVINWFGTTPSDFTEYLEPYLKARKSFANCGIYLIGQLGSIETLQEELFQRALYGNYDGMPKYGAFVFSTKLESAMYDYSFNLTVDPQLYDDLSSYFLKDPADIFWIGDRKPAPVPDGTPENSGEELLESEEVPAGN